MEHRELGENYFDRRDAEYTKANPIKRLSRLGYDVTVAPRAA
jgi:hypothetical protein